MQITISKPLCGFICLTLLLNINASLTPEQACSKIDNGVNQDGCKQFKNLQDWTESNLRSICKDSGRTDKHSSASVCEPYKGNEFYETSLKLAILNSMYGTTAIPQYGKCPWFCMYHPLYTDGPNAVGFKWSARKNCWGVLLGARNRLCYAHSYTEFLYAVYKGKNWCQGSTCEASTLFNRLRAKGLADPKVHTHKKPKYNKRPTRGRSGRRGQPKRGKPGRGNSGKPRPGKPGRPGTRKRGKAGRGMPGRPKPGRHTRSKPEKPGRGTRTKPGKPDGPRKPGKPSKRKSRKKHEKPQKADITNEVTDVESNPAKEIPAEDLSDVI